MVTGQVCRLSPVVPFHVKPGSLDPVAGPHGLSIFLEVVAYQGRMVADIADSEVDATIREGGVTLILIAQRHGINLSHYLRPRPLRRNAVLV